MFATFATLVFVPAMYRLLRRKGTVAQPRGLEQGDPLASA
jgi:hypothetical protein